MMIWCRVWLMPEEVNSFRRFAVEEPTDCIRTVILGPRPARSAVPVRLPMGMDSSRVETSEIRARTWSSTTVCRRLNSVMLLFTAVMRPSLSVSKAIIRSY